MWEGERNYAKSCPISIGFLYAYLFEDIGGLTSGSCFIVPGSIFGSFLIDVNESFGSLLIPGSVLIVAVSIGSVFITGSSFTVMLFVVVGLEDGCCKSIILFGKLGFGT